ncbi:MAG: hypothetical protein ACXWJK_07295 [Burkholderiaceae bacterium]
MKRAPANWHRSVWSVAAVISVTLAGCGGGSPADNPATINNPVQQGGSYLSFAYFQRCVNPIFLAQLQIQLNGVTSTNTCAGGGCHDTTTGAGGALRLVPSAQTVDVTNLSNTPTVIRTMDMYKNFYSAQAAVVIGAPTQSRLLNKPLLRGVLHGGGLIFLDINDPNAKLISYWISHPAPQGQDEFSTATYSMFAGNDPMNGTCNTQ